MPRRYVSDKELEAAMLDAFSCARIFKSSADEWHKKQQELIERFKLPMYRRYFMRGFFAACTEQLYRNDLVHGFLWGGDLYENWDTMPEDLKEHIRSHPSYEVASGHFWKGTTKPFFMNNSSTVEAAV